MTSLERNMRRILKERIQLIEGDNWAEALLAYDDAGWFDSPAAMETLYERLRGADK